MGGSAHDRTRSQWRLLDTGIRSADENIAYDHALLEARAEGLIPDTIRFLRFSPPAVLIGYHQVIDNEVRVSFCRRHGIDIQRRITGGGAIFFDQTQLGWEVIAGFQSIGFNRVTPGLFRIISEAVVAGLRKLGINACYRPRNDIEVNGRKISGTGGTEMGKAFLFQGTLLMDFDPQTMVRSLRIPVEKLKSHEIDSIKDRVTWVYKELTARPATNAVKQALIKGFEEHLNIKLQPGSITSREKQKFEEKIKLVKHKKWTHKIGVNPKDYSYTITLKKPKGLLKMLISVDLRSHTIKYTHFLGDFFSTPRDLVYNLEGALKFKRLSIPQIEPAIKDFFKSTKGRLLGFTPKDFVQLFVRAIDKTSLQKFDMSIEDANNLHSINGTYDDILHRNIRTILLPYCAKGASCKYRKKQGCVECQKCSTSDAYTLIRKYNLRPITINSFRHLMRTLSAIRHEDGFIGLCCEQFYIRHKKDMEKYRIPGLLLNIKDETCYDLDQVKDAELGNYMHQTELPLRLLEKVLKVGRNV